ncbi:phycobilisome rod-core linker polypeptide [Calothrix sp. PCC 6303]|uniref:phycobilisome rod-core linker polypeptide n=1 Tax=Calothrix sp. PCC 6303 TaxID=1170562 RepID=UPI0002A038DB|nr:phycobilisome rod-core linker polypeptide [Calothrix sp. PCC 6303]AFZ00390.1 Phycobilisome linker polypeptide [Calothrix sp. PCC 6303]
MLNTFVPPLNIGLSQLINEDGNPLELWGNASPDEIEVIIRGVYRHVLGNAYVMESERLVVPESQLKAGEITVREFVRQVAKSELYRSRFFDNCYRYRATELNFKHLLGRAPNSYQEVAFHSQILDESGFDADIDTYIDSDEYLNAFGENIVPFYRGYQTDNQITMLGFTNMLQLVRSNSGSDKEITTGNTAKLTRSLISNSPYGKAKLTDINALLAEVLKPKLPQEPTVIYSQQIQAPSQSDIERELQEKNAQIAALKRQLADLRPFANIGAFQTSGDWQVSPEKVDTQKQEIAALQEQIADARRLATIGEAKLNKWRDRVFRG